MVVIGKSVVLLLILILDMSICVVFYCLFIDVVMYYLDFMARVDGDVVVFMEFENVFFIVIM